MANPSPNPVPKKSLTDFVLEQKLAECSICRLPVEARQEAFVARKKHIDRDTVLAYLRAVWGWNGEDEEYTSHANGHHDKKLKELTAS